MPARAMHSALGSTEINEKCLSEVEKMLQEGHWPKGPPPIAWQGSDGRVGRAAGQVVAARSVVQEDEACKVSTCMRLCPMQSKAQVG